MQHTDTRSPGSTANYNTSFDSGDREPGADGASLGMGPGPFFVNQPAQVAPPECLTGALTPISEKPYDPQTPAKGLLLDYVRFTLPDEAGECGALGLLGIVNWVQQERGALGYRRVLVRGHQRVYLDGNPGMGIHVELSGQGCRELEGTEGFLGWETFLGAILSMGGHFTRSDWAWDDSEGLLNLETMAAAAEAEEWVSRWRQFEVVRKAIRVPLYGLWRQLKLTFGKRGSDAYLRAYDKAAQMGYQGHWVRVELELRNDRATAAVALFLREGPSALKGILRGYLEFKQPETATRRERCEVAPWWAAFLEYVEKARLVLKPEVRTLEKSWNWLQDQVAPTIAAVLLAFGDRQFESLVECGRQRLRTWHREQLRAMGVPVGVVT